MFVILCVACACLTEQDLSWMLRGEIEGVEFFIAADNDTAPYYMAALRLFQNTTYETGPSVHIEDYLTVIFCYV